MVGDSGWRSPMTFFSKVFSEQSWTLGRKPQCHLEQALSWDPETKEARCSGRPGVQKSGHLLDSNLLQNAGDLWQRKGSLGACRPAMKWSPQDHSELPELPTLADLLTGPCRITREQEVMENRVRNILQTTQGLPHYLPVLWPWGDPFMCQWPHLEKGDNRVLPHRASQGRCEDWVRTSTASHSKPRWPTAQGPEYCFPLCTDWISKPGRGEVVC